MAWGEAHSGAETIDSAALSRERPALLRYALLQVKQRDLAEDLVQETLLAALSAIKTYSGRSSVRAWLTAILRNKIADHFRSAGREVPLTTVEDDDGDEIDAYFALNGHYVDVPRDWGDPERTLTEKRFLQALQQCVSTLPRTAAQVFLMREVSGLDTEEICKELKISSSNCFVLLHRARMRLRACIEATWLEPGTSGAARK